MNRSNLHAANLLSWQNEKNGWWIFIFGSIFHELGLGSIKKVSDWLVTSHENHRNMSTGTQWQGPNFPYLKPNMYITGLIQPSNV